MLQDEPFHVDQTQAYCKWDFKYWNPKITTFPGLYVVGAAYAHMLSLLSAEGLEKVEVRPWKCSWHDTLGCSL